MRSLLKSPLFWACLLPSLAFVLAARIMSSAWIRVRSGDEMIRVVGSARKAIRSDFIIWRGTVSQQAVNMPLAYKALAEDVRKARRYLVKQGVPAKEIVPLSVSVETLTTRVPLKPNTPPASYNETNTTLKTTGYQLSQTLEVRSEKVDLLSKVSRESTELISQGLDFSSDEPMYLYTKMSDLKVSMQAEAAADAHARAEKIVQNSNSSLGPLRYARMSVPQITPLYSAAEDDGGTDDTTAIDKKITAVVSAGYGIR